MNLKYITKKTLKQIMHNYKLVDDDNVINDFIRFYLVFNVYYQKIPSKKYKEFYCNLINDTDWNNIIKAIKNNDFNLLDNNTKLNTLYVSLINSLIAYYNVDEINYFFENNYNQQQYEINETKYLNYLALNQIFLAQLMEILPKDFGSVYNYIKQNKKGV